MTRKSKTASGQLAATGNDGRGREPSSPTIIHNLVYFVKDRTGPLRVHAKNMGLLAVVRELLRGPLRGFRDHFVLGEGGECPGCDPYYWENLALGQAREQEQLAEMWADAAGDLSWLTSS